MHDLLTRSTPHPSWHAVLTEASKQLTPEYCHFLNTDSEWLPGPSHLLAAFRQPFENVRYVLFGESPYPRKQSANGFAFWDAAVSNLWSEQGLSKTVNRATSLRNLIKTLLLAEGALSPHTLTPKDIAALPKERWVQTLDALFSNMLTEGFLLLNTSLVLSQTPVRKEALAWEGFLSIVVKALMQRPTPPLFLIWGKVSEQFWSKQECAHNAHILCAEHPYNLSFIQNPAILNFFRPLQLLRKRP